MPSLDEIYLSMSEKKFILRYKEDSTITMSQEALSHFVEFDFFDVVRGSRFPGDTVECKFTLRGKRYREILREKHNMEFLTQLWHWAPIIISAISLAISIVK